MSRFLIIFLSSALTIYSQTNHSLSFDGDDDYVSTGIPYTDLLGAEEISISVSINWSSEDNDGGPSASGILSNGSSMDGHQLELNLNNNGNRKLGLYWTDGSTPDSPNMQSSFLDHHIIDFNTWYNIKVVLSNGTAKWYLEDELVDTDQVLFTSLGYYQEIGVPDLNIGRGNRVYDTHFHGLIDQVKISINGSEENLAYWNFNDGQGSVLTDLSGNGNNGTIYGATWEEVISGCTDPYAENYNENASINDGSCEYPENGDYALSFDGVDDYVTISRHGFIPSDTDFKVEVSFLSSTSGQTQGIIENGYGVDNGYRLSKYYDDKLYFHCANNFTVITDYTFSENEWYDLQIERIGDNVNFYVNEELIYNFDYNGELGSLDHSLRLGIGNDYDGPGEYLNGSIEDFNFSLNEELKIEYNFTAGEGDLVFDHSGNQNHGTINGATWDIETEQTMLSVEPNSAEAGTEIWVTITGTDTYFVVTDTVGAPSNIESVMFKMGENIIEAISFTPVSRTVLEAMFVIEEDVEIGLYDVMLEQIVGSPTSIYSSNAFTITSSSTNTPPTATPISVTGSEDISQTITLVGNDSDGDDLTYALASNPSNGTASLSGSEVTYTPNTNFNGSDNFTFTVSDEEFTSSPSTVDITLAAVNDVPVIASIPSLEALDGLLYEYSIDFTDIEGDDVVVSATTKPDWLSINNVNSNSLSFDGVDDYVLIPEVSSYIQNSDASLMGWFKINEFDGLNPLFGFRNYPDDYCSMYAVMGTNGTIETMVYGNLQSFITGHDANQWYHLAMVFNSQTETFNTYVNGELGSSRVTPSSIFDCPDIDLLIGGMQIGNFETLNGSIDDVSLWDISLTQDDIQAHMNTELSGGETGLTGYWNFNEGEGTALTDLSGNDNHGFVNGANWESSSSFILSGTPSLSNGGLHDIVLSGDDGNGGFSTQSYTLAVSLHSLEISGNSGFRIFSSPISGAVYSDLLDELWTQGAVGSDNPNSNPNIWTFGNEWNSVTDFSSDAITAGEGFLMYVYADTDFDGTDDLPVTISINGLQSQFGISVTSEPSAWNLMGNPYGLSVGISQMLTDNNGAFNSTVYAIDLDNPGYKFHNGLVGNIENAEIKPFEGFWIESNENGNTFQFTEQSIRKGSIDAPTRTPLNGSTGYAEFAFTNGTYTSTTFLSFSEEGEINLDPADADRLVPMSASEHLTSMIYESNKSLAINNLPFDLTTDISMDMDVMMLTPADDNGYATQVQQVDLTWDISNLPEGITLELRDNTTGQSINLIENLFTIVSLPNKGEFSTSGGFMGTYPTVGESQFTLSVYGNVTASVEDDILPTRLTLHDAYPNPFNPSTIISFDLKDLDMVSLEIYDVSGRQVASLIQEHMSPGNHEISWNPGDLASGLYLVNLVAGTETFNQKITYIK